MEAPVVTIPLTQEKSSHLHMTYEQFLDWADEDKHAEWINGEVVVQMPPKTRHQLLTSFLIKLIGTFVDLFQLGVVLPSPFEMKLGPDGPAREPDILFVARENRDRLNDVRLMGAADLVVEVISDESVARDRGDKFYDYQDAGVREYWIIDPRPGKERADFWVLNQTGRFIPMLPDKNGIYRSTVLTDFWVNVDWLLADELPEPLRCLAEIVGPQRLFEALHPPQH